MPIIVDGTTLTSLTVDGVNITKVDVVDAGGTTTVFELVQSRITVIKMGPFHINWITNADGAAGEETVFYIERQGGGDPDCVFVNGFKPEVAYSDRGGVAYTFVMPDETAIIEVYAVDWSYGGVDGWFDIELDNDEPEVDGTHLRWEMPVYAIPQDGQLLLKGTIRYAYGPVEPREFIIPAATRNEFYWYTFEEDQMLLRWSTASNSLRFADYAMPQNQGWRMSDLRVGYVT